MLIRHASLKDENSIFELFNSTIFKTFSEEGIDFSLDPPENEVSYKMDYFRRVLREDKAGFYVLFDHNQLIGTISYKPAEGDILTLSKGLYKDEYEVGSLYIDPHHQNKGYGTSLLIYVLKELDKLDVETFCLDCGYQRAQKIWTHLLKEPSIIDPNHFGKDKPLYIWKSNTKEILKNLQLKRVKTMNVKQMQEIMQNKEASSLELCQAAEEKVLLFKEKNAIANVCSNHRQFAELMDVERSYGNVRGPLHGIPIVIKDNIFYKDGKATSANSRAFKRFYPPYHAFIVKRLRYAGAIIFAKANMSELAYFMGGKNMPSGYGSLYGQVKHPFDESIDPMGSSTGSAVAVKLGIVPIALGTETNGSLMAPAYQSQIVSFKPSFGILSRNGIIPLSSTQDTAGPMANTVYDCGLVMDAINVEDPDDPVTLNLPRVKSFQDLMDQEPVKGKIGLLTIESRKVTQEEQDVIDISKNRLMDMGYEIVDLHIAQPNLVNYPTLLIEFKHAMTKLFNDYPNCFLYRSLGDLIDFNIECGEKCLKYGQDTLIESNLTDGDIESEHYLNLRKDLLEKASLLENLIKKHDLIAVGAPYWMGFAPIYGNPSICIPEGVFNKIPKAMVFVGGLYDDGRLMQFAHHYQLKQYEGNKYHVY